MISYVKISVTPPWIIQCSVPDAVGAQLQWYRAKWVEICASQIMIKGAQANWKDVEAPVQLQKSRKFQEFRGTEEEEKIYLEALQEEIQQGDETRIPMEEALFLNRTFAIPKKDEEHQKYLAFTFAKETYTYIGMPFGLQTALYIFHKHLHQSITLLRKEGIRMIVFIEDILILAQNPDLLILQTQRAKQLLESIEWIISPKLILISSQQVQHIGQMWNLTNLNIRMPEDKRIKMTSHLIN
ncbi:MAG: hypothetical protein EZS28_001149 [Streblomastix strix]|uniref:Reverse transcriptase domain-containing protein n=1 Tax=Streblomastix strix TaxID=222440 RepID=A0A5J4X7U6_9EUKA|nr:MAG: hypothetical protein EZS28_001149 [Streblomastix strix]